MGKWIREMRGVRGDGGKVENGRLWGTGRVLGKYRLRGSSKEVFRSRLRGSSKEVFRSGVVWRNGGVLGSAGCVVSFEEKYSGWRVPGNWENGKSWEVAMFL